MSNGAWFFLFMVFSLLFLLLGGVQAMVAFWCIVSIIVGTALITTLLLKLFMERDTIR